MADVTLKYKGATISELSESGSKTIETAGKYCEADILLEYVKSGGGSIAGINLLTGVGMNAGYLNTSGQPAAQSSTNKEYYSDEIDISDLIGEDLTLVVITENIGQQWLGYCLYNSSHTFISPRQNIMGAQGTALNAYGYKFNISDSSAKYIRISFRALGDNALYFLGKIDDAFDMFPTVGFCSI